LKIIKNEGTKLKFKEYDLKFRQIKLTPEECIKKNKTYSIEIYIKTKLLYKKKILINKYLPISEIPLITKKSCFIINGNKRVIDEKYYQRCNIYYIKLNIY
jgi:DNA-directed RNA polymerase beta subunit